MRAASSGSRRRACLSFRMNSKAEVEGEKKIKITYLRVWQERRSIAHLIISFLSLYALHCYFISKYFPLWSDFIVKKRLYHVAIHVMDAEFVGI